MTKAKELKQAETMAVRCRCCGKRYSQYVKDVQNKSGSEYCAFCVLAGCRVNDARCATNEGSE